MACSGTDCVFKLCCRNKGHSLLAGVLKLLNVGHNEQTLDYAIPSFFFCSRFASGDTTGDAVVCCKI